MIEPDDNTATATWELLQALLAQTPDGSRILELLATNPDAGLDELARYLAGEASPPGVATHVSGGTVDKLVNIARAQSVNVYGQTAPLTKEYVSDRLQLGWNAFVLRLELAASQTGHGAYPTWKLAEFVSIVNETFGLTLGPPQGPIPSGSFTGYFMQRMRPREPLGAAIFRVGTEISAWWQVKGVHGQEMNDMLEANLADALGELEAIRSGATTRVNTVLGEYREVKTDDPDDAVTRPFISKLAGAIVG